MTDLEQRLLNPAILLTMILSGVAYGSWLLWAVNIRDAVRLWSVTVIPGLIFVSLIWVVRAAQGTQALTYVLLGIDWLVFSNAAVVAVLMRRRFNRRS